MDTRETVVVHGVDSGVPNRSLAGICTINDHILDEEEWENHGQFIRHVTEVSREMRDAEVITARERAAIIAAAATSAGS